MEIRFKRRQTWNFIDKSHCAAAEAKEKVVSNEDLLTQILLHVPLRSLRKFKTVSKQWLSLITSSRFSLLLNNLPLRTSGVFLQRTNRSNKIIFIPLDDVHNHCRHDRPKALSDHPLYILQSCHGLLLLCSESNLVRYCTQPLYFVYNPSTNELATIQRNWHKDAIVWFSVIAFDPSKSPHYKIILCTDRYFDYKVRIEVYSSETRNWSVSKPPTPLIYSARPVYFNSCIHWIDHDNSCVYYNVDEARLESLPIPLTDLHEIKTYKWMWESEGHLHVAALCARQTSLDIYELKSDYSGWLVKYKVDLSKVFPELYNKDKCQYRVDVLSLVRRENCREDSVLVLKIPGKIILYNLVDASFVGNCQVWDF